MTYEEAANIVDPYERGRSLLKYNFFDRFEKQQEAYRIAAELLRKCDENATEIKPDSNQPLTLEQLREMYDNTDMCGLPSILEVTGVKCFGIVDRRDDDGICGVFAANGSWLKEKEYGKTWIAYAYPPAHIDREAWDDCPVCGKYKAISFKGFRTKEEAIDLSGNVHPHITGGAMFCPKCGKPRNERAWADLEQRLRG